MCKLGGGMNRCDCKWTPEVKERKRLQANANRVEARAIHRQYESNARHLLGDAAGSAIGSLTPRELVPLTMALEGSNPELAQRLREGIHRNLPGVHNMITIDRRSHHKGADGTDVNEGKSDPYALAGIQKAMLAIDESAAMDATDSGTVNAILESVGVRRDALEAGVLNGRPMTKERIANLTDEQKAFYANTNPKDLLHLVSVEQRVDDAFFSRHLNDATFHSRKRSPDAQVPLLTDKGVPRTLSDILKDTPRGSKIRLAEGLTVYQRADGSYWVEDADNNVTLPASGFMRGSQVIDRLPVINDITVDRSTGASQRLVENDLLDPTSPRGRAHTRALRQAAVTNMWNSGVPVNHGENGKAQWQNHKFLTNMGVGVPLSTGLTRRAGMNVQGHYNARKEVLDEGVRARLDAMGRTYLTEDKTPSGSPRTTPHRAYNGDLGKEARELIKRQGYNPRTFKKGTSAPEAVAATNIDRSKFDTAPGDKAFNAADARTATLTATTAADMARAANAFARLGRHPDLGGDYAFTSKAALEDVFRTQRQIPRTEPVPVVTYDSVPAKWDDAVDGDYLDTVFKPGSRIDTKGYTVGAVNGSEAAKRSGPGIRRKPFQVKYLARSVALVPGGTAIIDDAAGFRVHSVDRSGDVPTVYLVSDDYAADVASSAA